MNATTAHRLEGLEPDNLLAFLALLGLLRSLEAAGLRPRAHWHGVPLRPVLSVPEPMTHAELTEQAAAGAQSAAHAFSFAEGAEFSFDRKRLRSLISDQLACEPRSAIQSDAALSAFVVEGAALPKSKPGGHCFERAPLDCLGGGQTDLFATLSDALALRRKKSFADDLARAIYGTWDRTHDGKSLRWDRADFRQHAHSAIEPSKDHKRQEWGANLLAAIGVTAVSGVAARHAASVRFKSLGTRIGPGDTMQFSWPIWKRPASLSGIRALLAHPEVSADRPDLSRLRQAAVTDVYRSEKIWPTRYAVFTRAEVV